MDEQKFCQSCGMPLDDEKLVGTNADKSKNHDYCVYCFADGAFTQDVTMQEMIDISMQHMNELFADDPNFKADEVMQNMQSFFPLLKRWKA